MLAFRIKGDIIPDTPDAITTYKGYHMCLLSATLTNAQDAVYY